jgi:CHASE2 domain-containing sensor protein
VQSWLRNAWFDAYQIAMPRSRVSAPAVIVAVDEKSLAQLGQWPWPRTLIARVLDRLAEYRPLAVGLDVIFAEPDRLSPGAIADLNPHLGHALALQLRSLLSNDEVLAAAIRRLPVVLGVAGTYDAWGAVPRSAACSDSGQSAALARISSALAGLTRRRRGNEPRPAQR